jgi:hypothetical protein
MLYEFEALNIDELQRVPEFWEFWWSVRCSWAGWVLLV